MESFVLENFGPIRKAEVTFGDLTVLIGPQATGKSLFLKMHKWQLDAVPILEFKAATGFDWPGSPEDMLRLYLGDESGELYAPNTRINGATLQVPDREKGSYREKNLYIPANRDSIFYNNFPRHPDKGFLPFDPYVTRILSELVIEYFDKINQGTPTGLEPRFWQNNSIYYGQKPKLEVKNQQYRISIKQAQSQARYSEWSFGMKSFLPIIACAEPLLRFGNPVDVNYFVIEEPEIGLHPKAIQDFMLLAFELLAKGFKVALSTHSDYILETMWVLNQISSNNENFEVLEHLFETETRPVYKEIFKALSGKSFRTYSFHHSLDGTGVVTKDITSLDALSEDEDIASWGGFMNFKDRANRVVATVNQVKF